MMCCWNKTALRRLLIALCRARLDSQPAAWLVNGWQQVKVMLWLTRPSDTLDTERGFCQPGYEPGWLSPQRPFPCLALSNSSQDYCWPAAAQLWLTTTHLDGHKSRGSRARCWLEHKKSIRDVSAPSFVTVQSWAFSTPSQTNSQTSYPHRCLRDVQQVNTCPLSAEQAPTWC